MATINNINISNFGLYLSSYDGIADLPEGKEQFYTIYGKAGYQITKRRANVLELNAFIIANSLEDFKAKTTALYNLFSSEGIKVVNIGNGDLNTFAKEGFKISGVYIRNKVYAKFFIQLDIVA